MTISYVGFFIILYFYSVSVSKCLYNAVILEIRKNGEKITENEKQIRALNLQIVFKFVLGFMLKIHLNKLLGDIPCTV